jgi:hypothetical protein
MTKDARYLQQVEGMARAMADIAAGEPYELILDALENLLGFVIVGLADSPGEADKIVKICSENLASIVHQNWAQRKQHAVH